MLRLRFHAIRLRFQAINFLFLAIKKFILAIRIRLHAIADFLYMFADFLHLISDFLYTILRCALGLCSADDGLGAYESNFLWSGDKKNLRPALLSEGRRGFSHACSAFMRM